nr:hypothetical protein [Octadecabacter arcticus]
MTIHISQHILRLKGQRVNEIELAEDGAKVIVQCSRDARRSAIDPATGNRQLYRFRCFETHTTLA